MYPLLTLYTRVTLISVSSTHYTNDAFRCHGYSLLATREGTRTGGTGPCSSLTTEGKFNSGGTSMEDTDLVPSSAGDVQGLPTADSPQEGPNSTSTSTGNAGCVTQLAVWRISGDDTKSNSFRRKLQNSCLHHEKRNPPRHMTCNSRDGLAGVIHGVQIPFLALSAR